MERRNFLRGAIIAPLAAAAAKFSFGKTVTPATPTEGIAAAASSVGMPLAEQQGRMLAKMMKTVGGRQMLAASLGPSIRRRKKVMGFGSAPTIHTQSSTYVRHRDKFDLFVIGDEGGDIVYKKNYRDDDTIVSYRVQVPVFSISSTPMIPLDMVMAEQFDLIARSLNLAKGEIGHCEDSYILAMWDTGAQMANDGKIDGNKDIPWSDNVFAEAKETFAKRGLSMKACFMNPKTGGVEVLKWLGTNRLDTLCRERKDLIRGVIGYKDDVEFRQTRKVAPGYAYFTAERAGTSGGRTDLGLIRYTKDIYAAYMIEETPLEVTTADRPELEHIGFNFTEEVGFAANPVAVQRVTFDPEFVKARESEPWINAVEDLAGGN